MTRPAQPTPTIAEACVVIGLCFGWFIYGSVWSMAAGFPASSGSFTDGAFVSLIGTELVLGALALLLLRWRGYDLAQLLPRPGWRGSVLGVLLFFAVMLMWTLLSHLFPASEHAAQPITEMVSNTHVTLPMVLAVSMVNGLYEETFLVGYLVRGLEAHGASLALGVSALVRLMYHLYQGPIGSVSVLAFGLLVSLFYWRTRRLWPVVLCHSLVDIVAFT